MNRWAGIVVGVVLAVAVVAGVAAAWQPLYANHPYPGYERAAARGQLPHAYTSSPRALRDVLLAFLAAGVLVGLSRPAVATLVLSWTAIWVTLFLIFLLSPAAAARNLAPVAFVLFAVHALAFLLPALIFRQVTVWLRGRAANKDFERTA